MRRLALALTVCASLVGSGIANAAPVAPRLVESSSKVCQLTGERDWASHAFTAARTKTRGGLDGVDLGYPVEVAGTLYFLFGDSWPSGHGPGPAGELPPDDAVGATTRTAQPDATNCTGMSLVVDPLDGRFSHPTVTAPKKIHQGYFNVPSGGVGIGKTFYAFFWTNNCDTRVKLTPAPDAPISRPSPTPGCPETSDASDIGESVLARSGDGGRTFTALTLSPKAAMPKGFVYVTAAHVADSDTIVIAGIPRYRASLPYVATAHAKQFEDPTTWRYFTGFSDGKPAWVDYERWQGAAPDEAWKPPGSAEAIAPATDDDRCIGEFSLKWNKVLRKWLMLYVCTGTVWVRAAGDAWGPWSSPAALLNVRDPGVPCVLVMTAGGCPGKRNFQPLKPDNSFTPGGFYSPYVMERYTVDRSDATQRRATIYYTLSTWNPYEVSIIKSTIALSK